MIARLTAGAGLVLALAVAASPADAYWTGAGAGADRPAQGTGAAVAATVGRGAVPVVTVEGHGVRLVWAATRLDNGATVDGYRVTRYAATGDAAAPAPSSGCAGTVAGPSCVESDTPAGDWRYTVTPLVGSHWRGAESARGAAVDEPASGDAPAAPPVASPAPPVARPLAASAGPDAAPAAPTSAGASPALPTPDTVAPTGGSVDATGLDGGYATAGGVRLALAPGTDDGSGLADGMAATDLPARLLRAAAPLRSADGIADGTCGTYGAYTPVGPADPGTTFVDEDVADAMCYRYNYLVADHAGNVATYPSGDVRRMAVAGASVAPTAVTITATSGAAARSTSAAAPAVYVNPARPGSFTVEASAAEAATGIAWMTFPAPEGFLGGGAVTAPSPGAAFHTTYSWPGDGSAPSPGPLPLAATDHAGHTRVSAAAFSIVTDTLAPSGGTVDVDGPVTSTTPRVAFAPGADSGAGLAATGRRLSRASAAMTAGGACGVFGPAVPIGGPDPSSPLTDVVPGDQACYRYIYTVADAVGNTAAFTSADVRVDPATRATGTGTGTGG